MLRRSFCSLLVVAVVVVACDFSFGEDYVYWSTIATQTPSVIKRARLDGTGVETITTAVSDRFGGLAFDVANGHLYSGDGNSLFRANLDGTNRVNLVSCGVLDVEVDLVHSKVYWSTYSVPRGIYRANLDGSNVETIVSMEWYNLVEGLALDPTRNRLYYAFSSWPGIRRIRSCDLIGSNASEITPPGSLAPFEMEIDAAAGKVYWDTYGDSSSSIYRANLDLSGVETVPISVGGFSNGMHVDAQNQKIYFNAAGQTTNTLSRANLDGSGLEALWGSDAFNYMEVAHNLVTNRNPLANAGPDQTVNTGPQVPVTVTLDGTASSDPDGDTLEYVWTVPAGSPVSIANPNSAVTTATIQAPQSGDYSILLTVTDGKGGVDTDEVVIHVVVDSTPPVITCWTDKDSLWPPDHRIVEVTLSVTLSDGDVTAQCTSSEPDDALGDGAYTGDVNGGDGFSAPQPVALSYDATLGRYVGKLQLRAERDGSEVGRTYTIICTATDDYGNSDTARCAVVVPHDRRKN